MGYACGLFTAHVCPPPLTIGTSYLVLGTQYTIPCTRYTRYAIKYCRVLTRRFFYKKGVVDKRQQKQNYKQKEDSVSLHWVQSEP